MYENQEELLIEVKVAYDEMFKLYSSKKYIHVKANWSLRSKFNISFGQVDPQPEQLASPEDVV